MIDLCELDINRVADAGIECELHHPVTGTALGVWVTVMGADSLAYRTVMIERAREFQRRAKADPDAERTPDQIEEDTSIVCARCTRGWRGVRLDGQDLPWSHDNAVMLFRRFVWMRQQINEFIEERHRFLPGSATLS